MKSLLKKRYKEIETLSEKLEVLVNRVKAVEENEETVTIDLLAYIIKLTLDSYQFIRESYKDIELYKQYLGEVFIDKYIYMFNSIEKEGKQLIDEMSDMEEKLSSEDFILFCLKWLSDIVKLLKINLEIIRFIYKIDSFAKTKIMDDMTYILTLIDDLDYG
ncbi:hypothetical protein LF845_09855 [Deferribacterales bacterium Es71-Z0220]|uniref:hypothetical protein n=1 Tax=Deferrivibrio essentukiensis TaxID=2880922 RepID=UPI001F617B13|nr:hypothetical protein [Deferrivibrio essentukiensis]MCB4205261.1 hypothetical protein [Deferrivibrio essentukiensis]